MPYPNQHHKLIYGYELCYQDTEFKTRKKVIVNTSIQYIKKESYLPYRNYYVKSDDTDDDTNEIRYLKIIPPFKQYTMPMYGGSENHKFIGYEYGRINGIFNQLHYDTTELHFSHSKVPDKIVELWKKTYPKLEAKCYAIIQDVYTCHYANGYVGYGYWMFEYDNCDGYCFGNDLESLEHHYISQISHTMKDTPSSLFCGVNLNEFSNIDELDDCEELAEQLCQVYKPSSKLASRETIIMHITGNVLSKLNHNIRRIIMTKLDDILSPTPVIAFIPTMCYCCT